jgi:hypothetical protein
VSAEVTSTTSIRVLASRVAACAILGQQVQRLTRDREGADLELVEVLAAQGHVR